MIRLGKDFVVSLLLLLTVAVPLHAQQDLEAYVVGGDEETRSLRMAPDFADDFAYILSTPSRIDENSLTVIGGLSIMTAGIMAGIDTPVYNSTQSYDHAPNSLLAAPGRFYDTVNPSLFAFGSSGLLIGSGYLLKDKKMARTGWTAVEAIVLTQLATGFLKTTVGRERPFVRDGNFDFDLFDINDGNSQRSFPSGHTSKIFALSTVIASSYDSPWVRIPAYGLAGSVALQRVESGKHWVSDVVVGGAIGYFMGRALAKQNGLVKSSSRVYPVVQGGLVGFNVRF